MPLDQRGKISIAEIVFYVPTLFLAFFLTLRHGFRREAGWVFLLIFSVVRIVGGALHIAAEQKNPPTIGLFVAALSLEAAGLGPLLLCTTAFLGVVSQHIAQRLPLANNRIFRLLKLLIIIAFVLAIVGGSDAASDSEGTRSTGTTLRKVASILLAASFIAITVIHVLFWANKDLILLHRRTLLIGISAALPFLAVRVLYSVLSAFSPAPTFGPDGPTTPDSTLSKFNSITGHWQIFLVMSLVMEYIIVMIYIAVGTMIPLQSDDQYLGVRKNEEHELGGQQAYQHQPPLSHR